TCAPASRRCGNRVARQEPGSHRPTLGPDGAVTLRDPLGRFDNRPRGGAVAEGPAAQFLTVVRAEQAAQVRPRGDDAGGVHVAVDVVVVLLDLREVAGVAEAGRL